MRADNTHHLAKPRTGEPSRPAAAPSPRWRNWPAPASPSPSAPSRSGPTCHAPGCTPRPTCSLNSARNEPGQRRHRPSPLGSPPAKHPSNNDSSWPTNAPASSKPTTSNSATPSPKPSATNARDTPETHSEIVRDRRPQHPPRTLRPGHVHHAKPQVNGPPQAAAQDNDWIVGPDLFPDLFGERGERQDVCPVVLEVLGDLGQLLGQRVQDPVVSRDNGIGVGLVVDGMQQGPDPRPAGGTDRRDEPLVASEVTRATPVRPRAVRSRKKLNHPAPSSAEVTCTPGSRGVRRR
jgi:hypothetical protein